jgi:tetratricopeptide (TPR) repeat protein
MNDDRAMKVDQSEGEDPDEPPPRQSSRPLGPPVVTAGPLGQLKLQLHRLYLDAGHPGYDRIVWLIGRDGSLPGAPARDTVQKIMRVDGFAGKQGDVVSIATVLAREGHVRDVPDLLHGLWVKAHQFAPVGELISEARDPLAFEVHRAIDALSTRGMTSTVLPLLPAYVQRAHDRLLEQAIARVAAGASELVTLVGGSSTGKTRACWEALHQLPEGWRVWHPLRPDRPEAFLEELPSVGPATVVWLNEAQHYLSPTRDRIGEKVSAELRDLLRTPGRGPVLVLATMWPQFWDELTHKFDPPAEEDRVHAQARDLLERGMHVLVEATFDEHELAAVRNRSADDPRLVQALEHAEQGHITQYLAGGPALIQRYETAGSAAKAMIEAAMDARRLGHSLGLPLAFLQAAAPAYLTDLQWDGLKEDWLEQALAYVAEPCRGTRGPLTRIRTRPGDTDPDQPQYRLADYLEQYGRTQRRTVKVPWGFWDAATAHANPGDRAALGSAAQARGLLRLAFHLYTSTTTGNAGALGPAARMLLDAGRIEEATLWYQRAAEAGDSDALEWADWLLQEAGRIDEVIPWFQDSAEAGDTFAERQRTRMHLRTLAQMLREAGPIDEAIPWLPYAARAGDSASLEPVARVLREVGRIDEAIPWFQRAAQAGDTDAPGQVARMLQEVGRIDEAIPWFQRAAQAGDTDAPGQVARMLQEVGRIDEAIPWFQYAAQAEASALWPLEAGRIDEAIPWLQYAAAAGDTKELGRVARRLREAGRIDEVIPWLHDRAEAGDIGALGKAVGMLRKAGRIDEASRLRQFGWEPDGSLAPLWNAETATTSQQRSTQ